MGLIERSDLSLEYDWSTTPGGGPIDKDEGKKSAVFDNKMGDDVLSLLNNYAEKSETDSKKELLKAESLIRNELPKDLNTRESAMDWLWSKMGHDLKLR